MITQDEQFGCKSLKKINKLGLTQNFLKPSPLDPLPLRARRTRKLFDSPSPVLGEGVGGRGLFLLCVSPNLLVIFEPLPKAETL
jgi:hypothetical protein